MQVQEHIRNGFRHCVDMDLSTFCDRVQHDMLVVRVSRKVHDKRLLKLLGRFLRAGIMVDTDFQPSIESTMQGGWVTFAWSPCSTEREQFPECTFESQ